MGKILTGGQAKRQSWLPAPFQPITQPKDDPMELDCNCWIGDLCLFKEMTYSNTVISVSHSELLMVGRQEVKDLCNEFPTSVMPIYNKWIKKTARLCKDKGSQIASRCEHCNELGHAAADCPKLQNELATNSQTSADTNDEVGKTKSKIGKLGAFMRSKTAAFTAVVSNRRATAKVNSMPLPGGNYGNDFKEDDTMKSQTSQRSASPPKIVLLKMKSLVMGKTKSNQSSVGSDGLAASQASKNTLT